MMPGSDTLTGWQPIATAPKDGRSVLLCWTDIRIGPLMGKWVVAREDGEDAGWFCWGPHVNGYCIAPTHWTLLMPLPAPPEATHEPA